MRFLELNWHHVLVLHLINPCSRSLHAMLLLHTHNRHPVHTAWSSGRFDVEVKAIKYEITTETSSQKRDGRNCVSGLRSRTEFERTRLRKWVRLNQVKPDSRETQVMFESIPPNSSFLSIFVVSFTSLEAIVSKKWGCHVSLQLTVCDSVVDTKVTFQFFRDF